MERPINLFNYPYRDGVEKIETSSHLCLRHRDAEYRYHKNAENHFFIDFNGNSWVYSPSGLTVNDIDMELDVYLINGTQSIIRTATPEEVIQKAGEYFVPYIEGSSKPKIIIPQKFFTLEYDKKVEKYFRKEENVLMRGEALFVLQSDQNSYFFQDETGSRWFYSPVKQLNIETRLETVILKRGGFIKGNNEDTHQEITYVRVHTPDEVLQRVEDYFLPYALPDPGIKITLREQDQSFYLN